MTLAAQFHDISDTVDDLSVTGSGRDVDGPATL